MSDTNYGWYAESGDNLGDNTNTTDWNSRFNDTKMPRVYASASRENRNGNGIAQPAGDNGIVRFKSCYHLSEVGSSIDDEKAVYSGLLARDFYRTPSEKGPRYAVISGADTHVWDAAYDVIPVIWFLAQLCCFKA